MFHIYYIRSSLFHACDAGILSNGHINLLDVLHKPIESF